MKSSPLLLIYRKKSLPPENQGNNPPKPIKPQKPQKPAETPKPKAAPEPSAPKPETPNQQRKPLQPPKLPKSQGLPSQRKQAKPEQQPIATPPDEETVLYDAVKDYMKNQGKGDLTSKDLSTVVDQVKIDRKKAKKIIDGWQKRAVFHSNRDPETGELRIFLPEYIKEAHDNPENWEVEEEIQDSFQAPLEGLSAELYDRMKEFQDSRTLKQMDSDEYGFSWEDLWGFAHENLHDPAEIEAILGEWVRTGWVDYVPYSDTRSRRDRFVLAEQSSDPDNVRQIEQEEADEEQALQQQEYTKQEIEQAKTSIQQITEKNSDVLIAAQQKSADYQNKIEGLKTSETSLREEVRKHPELQGFVDNADKIDSLKQQVPDSDELEHLVYEENYWWAVTQWYEEEERNRKWGYPVTMFDAYTYSPVNIPLEGLPTREEAEAELKRIEEQLESFYENAVLDTEGYDLYEALRYGATNLIDVGLENPELEETLSNWSQVKHNLYLAQRNARNDPDIIEAQKIYDEQLAEYYDRIDDLEPVLKAQEEYLNPLAEKRRVEEQEKAKNRQYLPKRNKLTGRRNPGRTFVGETVQTPPPVPESPYDPIQVGATPEQFRSQDNTKPEISENQQGRQTRWYKTRAALMETEFPDQLNEKLGTYIGQLVLNQVASVASDAELEKLPYRPDFRKAIINLLGNTNWNELYEQAHISVPNDVYGKPDKTVEKQRADAVKALHRTVADIVGQAVTNWMSGT